MSIVQPELFTEQVDQALNRLVEMVDKRTASSHISLGLWKTGAAKFSTTPCWPCKTKRSACTPKPCKAAASRT